MPRTTHCPECRHTFRVPDFMARRQVKCPACAHPFTAEPDAEAPSGSKLDLPAVPPPDGGSAEGRNGASAPPADAAALKEEPPAPAKSNPLVALPPDTGSKKDLPVVPGPGPEARMMGAGAGGFRPHHLAG